MSSELSIPLKDDLFAGRYKPIRLLGKGGMGEVYLVKDSMLDNEEVALKILKKDYIENEKQISRFLREVKLARQVTHPAVVRTYDVGQSDGLFYLTMERVNGQSIKEYLKEHGPLPYRKVCEYLMSLCEGLHEVHKLNIIHRDLKPANILLPESGGVKITDFGIARPNTSSLTSHDEIVGSTHYLAPEIWLGKELSSATDIYALGIVAYEMLTGCTPFDAENPAELMWKHLDVNPVAPSALEPAVPPWLDELVLALLGKDQDRRPCDAHEIWDFILRATAEDEVRTTGDYIAALEGEIMGEPEVQSEQPMEFKVVSETPSIESAEKDLIADRLTGGEIPTLEPEEMEDLDAAVDEQKKSQLITLPRKQIAQRLQRLGAGLIGTAIALMLVFTLGPLVVSVLQKIALKLTGSRLLAENIRGLTILLLLTFSSLTPLFLIHIQTKNLRSAVNDTINSLGVLYGLSFLMIGASGLSAKVFSWRALLQHDIENLFALATISAEFPCLLLFGGEVAKGTLMLFCIFVYGSLVSNVLLRRPVVGLKLFSQQSAQNSLRLIGMLALTSFLIQLTGLGALLFGSEGLFFSISVYTFEIHTAYLTSGIVSVIGLLFISVFTPEPKPLPKRGGSY